MWVCQQIRGCTVYAAMADWDCLISVLYWDSRLQQKCYCDSDDLQDITRSEILDTSIAYPVFINGSNDQYWLYYHVWSVNPFSSVFKFAFGLINSPLFAWPTACLNAARCYVAIAPAVAGRPNFSMSLATSWGASVAPEEQPRTGSKLLHKWTYRIVSCLAMPMNHYNHNHNHH